MSEALLVASAVAGNGGVPVVNRLLLDALPRLGWNVSVVCLDDHRHPRRERPDRAAFVRAALRSAQRIRPRLLFATHVGMSPVARLAAGRVAGSGRGWRQHSRVACWLHGVDAWEPMSRARRWGLSGADLAITSSTHTLERFRAAHPSFGELSAASCSLPARRLASDIRVSDPATARTVLSVGRLWGRGLQKGQRALIEAWPRVLATHGDWRLVIIGDGDGAADLQAQAQACGVAEFVEFRGAVDDAGLERAYSEAAVFALPSRGEGFGLVLAEAMSHGVCCIASTADAGAEVVDHGRTGLLVDPDRPAELEAALDRLLSDPALRVSLGRAALAEATTRFSLEAFDARLAAALALLRP